MSKEGWVWLINANKRHYFTEDYRSLCGRWMVFSLADLQQGNDASPDNCKACQKALKRLQEKRDRGKTFDLVCEVIADEQ